MFFSRLASQLRLTSVLMSELLSVEVGECTMDRIGWHQSNLLNWMMSVT